MKIWDISYLSWGLGAADGGSPHQCALLLAMTVFFAFGRQFFEVFEGVRVGGLVGWVSLRGALLSCFGKKVTKEPT